MTDAEATPDDPTPENGAPAGTPVDPPLDESALGPSTIENPVTPARAGGPGPDAATGEQAVVPPLRFSYFAVSDVGRVRKDNQDSGYAGPWLLAVCDGVGGAARGDIASSTAITELRQLDEPPGAVDLIDRVNDGLHEAHVSIGSQVDQDPSLNGTSTTATVGLFDGRRLALGHVGDSRAYLLREGELSQLTNDHTFVQSLIDEGRITEEEARIHPHRNLILKALDGLHDVEPDLFALELAAGDRLFLCSDGACGTLTDSEMAAILQDGTPEVASTELVRASLDGGSTDNVTCVVADVLSNDPEVAAAPTAPDASGDRPTATAAAPMVVGAAAELRTRRVPQINLFRRADTGELPPVQAEIPEGIDYAIRADPPLDPETMRYAPQAPRRFVWARRGLVLAVLLGAAWIVLGSAWYWSQQQFFVGEHDGNVSVYRGVDVPGMSHVEWTSDVALADLGEVDRDAVRERFNVDSLEDAKDKLAEMVKEAAQDDGSVGLDDTGATGDPSPFDSTSACPTP